MEDCNELIADIENAFEAGNIDFSVAKNQIYVWILSCCEYKNANNILFYFDLFQTCCLKVNLDGPNFIYMQRLIY